MEAGRVRGWLRRWGGIVMGALVAIGALAWSFLSRRRAARIEAADRAIDEVGRSVAVSTAVAERDRELERAGASVEEEIRDARRAAETDDIDTVRGRVEARARSRDGR